MRRTLVATSSQTPMGRYSGIEWTHHTFNPWWGCTKVSPACAHCYAESWSKRVGLALWGEESPRRFFADAHWKQPLLWDKAAASDGDRHRVFAASMADVFEDRVDLVAPRERLWELIAGTPNLDWLLLTKRPELVAGLVPWVQWPHNVWLGVTAENQRLLDQRLTHLGRLPAVVRFLSCEPLLGSLDVTRHARSIDWVITGGETGGRSRPTHPKWFGSLRDQCLAEGIPFHFKQWGDWHPDLEGSTSKVVTWKGAPARLQRVGKRVAGRLLEGRTWDGLPQPRPSLAALRSATA